MNLHGKSVDKTYLNIDQAEERGFIHRDYIAHCLRWSHVCKRLYERKRYESAIILDVGCGRELPMAKMLYSSRLIPSHYFGVDVGPIEDTATAAIGNGKFPHTVWENTNFLDLQIDDVHFVKDGVQFGPVNIVISFEVLEHVEPKMMIDMLKHMQALTTADVRFFISTPCWNVTDCAANHVNEIKYDVLGSVFERLGFVVEHVYGTFASIRDYQHLLEQPGKVYECGADHPQEIFEKLREYYDTNFLSCIFAPLFPAQSRNCLWELSKSPAGVGSNKFPQLSEIPEPWSSSTLWKELA